MGTIGQSTIDPSHVSATLAEFSEFWDALYPQEKTQIVHRLVEGVIHDRDSDMLVVFVSDNGNPWCKTRWSLTLFRFRLT